MQVRRHQQAQRTDLRGCRQQVGDHDGHHAGGARRADAIVRIRKRHARFGRDRKPRGGGEKRVGRRLSIRVIASADNRVKPADKIVRRQMALHRGVRR